MIESAAALDPARLAPGDELNLGSLVGAADPISDTAELCYIPTFGGGFAMTWTEIERWPVSRKRRMLEWLEERRAKEQKNLGGAASRGAASGRTKRGPEGYTAPPGAPVLSGPPEPPTRPSVGPPGPPPGAGPPGGAGRPQDARGRPTR